MKNFKNIYKLLLILPLIFVVSCDDSDDIIEVLTNTATTAQSTVFIETDDASQFSRTVGVNSLESISVGVNNALEADLIVSFSVMKDGVTAILNTDYTLTDATIITGELFQSSDLTFLELGEYEVVIGSASDTSLEVAPNKLLFSVKNLDAVFNFTWDGASDLDCRIINGDGITISTGYSVSPGETVEILSAEPDGDFIFTLRPWTVDSASVDYTIEVITGAGAEVFNGTLIDGTNFWTQEFVILEIVKATDSVGDVTYTITQL